MKNDFIIASTNNSREALWKQGLNGFAGTVLTNIKLEALLDDVVRIEPEVILLDIELLKMSSNGAAHLRKLCSETRTIVLSDAISEDMEWELLKAGVRGCCQYDINPKILNKVVIAVQQGELWIRRTLASRLVDELGKTTSKNKAYRATLGLLNKLTQREYDIAVRVGNGECNKQIAQSCGITERTVKAHLTEIYLKLGVTDRLNLALVLSADNRITFPNSDISLSGGSRVNDNK